MSDFTGDKENYEEIVFNLMIDFDQMKEKLGDKADIELLLAQYPENIRDSLRKDVQELEQFSQEQTPQDVEAMLPALMSKIHGTLGEQVQQHQKQYPASTDVLDLVQKGNLNITSLSQSSLKLTVIRNMSRNERLKLGKQFGLTTNNLQLIQCWLDWLDTLVY